MSFLKGWKMKSPAMSGPKPDVGDPSAGIAALNPSKAMATPEQTVVRQVSPIDNQFSKFHGLQRRLSKDRNTFKRSTDSSDE